MKIYSIMFAMLMLSGCASQGTTLKDATKETAKDVATGVGNLVEGVKQMPDAISKAAQKVKEDNTKK